MSVIKLVVSIAEIFDGGGRLAAFIIAFERSWMAASDLICR